MAFPVLNFKLKFNLPIYIKYCFITLIFNFADFISRLLSNNKFFKI